MKTKFNIGSLKFNVAVPAEVAGAQKDVNINIELGNIETEIEGSATELISMTKTLVGAFAAIKEIVESSASPAPELKTEAAADEEECTDPDCPVHGEGGIGELFGKLLAAKLGGGLPPFPGMPGIFVHKGDLSDLPDFIKQAISGKL